MPRAQGTGQSQIYWLTAIDIRILGSLQEARHVRGHPCPRTGVSADRGVRGQGCLRAGAFVENKYQLILDSDKNQDNLLLIYHFYVIILHKIKR